MATRFNRLMSFELDEETSKDMNSCERRKRTLRKDVFARLFKRKELETRVDTSQEDEGKKFF